MMNKKQLVMATCIFFFLSGCASTGVDNSDRNRFVVEFFAEVVEMKQVRFDSKIKEAIAIGAVTGAASQSDEDKEKIVGGAVIGGLFAGILTAIFEGSTKGYEYKLQAVDGDEVTVILDQKPAILGDCVKVRVSGKVSMSRTDKANCDFEI